MHTQSDVALMFYVKTFASIFLKHFSQSCVRYGLVVCKNKQKCANSRWLIRHVQQKCSTCNIVQRVLKMYHKRFGKRVTCLNGASSVFGFRPIFFALAGQFGVPCCTAFASLTTTSVMSSDRHQGRNNSV